MKLSNSIMGRLLIFILIMSVVIALPTLVAKIPLVIRLATDQWPYLMENPRFIDLYGIGVLAIMIPLIALLIISSIVMWILTGFE